MRTARQVIVALSVATIVLCSWFAPLDAPAIQQVDAGLKRALFSFATARALNAVISVAQGTELSVQPIGIGINFAPGQVLDPANDLVEQFSNLMLVASVAFGIQKILIGVGAYWLISLALTTAAIGWAWHGFRQLQPPGWLSKMFVILLMLRFAVPVVTLGTDLLYQKFLATDYKTSQQVIDSVSGQVDKLNPPIPNTAETPGLLDKMKGWWPQNLNAKMHYENMKQAAEQATEHIIKLIVIFLLQTLIIPLLLLWALYSVARSAFEWRRQMPDVGSA
ncbi:MAG: hypothetical protein Q8K18_00575 [Burkholderiales bacterium]|nr:hypothetical protein [Burkholderiales bacterium]